MFTYVGLFKLAPIAREHVEKTPEYFEQIHKIVEVEGGTVERSCMTQQSRRPAASQAPRASKHVLHSKSWPSLRRWRGSTE